MLPTMQRGPKHSRQPGKKRTGRTRTYRPTLELLEARLAPALSVVNSPLDTVGALIGDSPAAASNGLNTLRPAAILVSGANAGGAPNVHVYDAGTGQLLTSFLAFDQNFRGGVRIAVGDVNGDGIADVICGAGPGGGPHVRVFSGNDAHELASFYAYDAAFTGGVFVAGGDVNGDGHADIISGAGAGGGPHVRVYSGVDLAQLASFFAYDSGFTGGVSVAVTDANGDGATDIITGAGAGGGAHVRTFNGLSAAPIDGFFAVDVSRTDGVFVGGPTDEYLLRQRGLTTVIPHLETDRATATLITTAGGHGQRQRRRGDH